MQFQAILTTFRFFRPKSYFLCDLKPHAKFQNPTITPSWRKVSEGKEREEKKLNMTAHASGSDQFMVVYQDILSNVLFWHEMSKMSPKIVCKSCLHECRLLLSGLTTCYMTILGIQLSVSKQGQLITNKKVSRTVSRLTLNIAFVMYVSHLGGCLERLSNTVFEDMLHSRIFVIRRIR